ncbi:MAG: GDSL-like Lipase/Acylhydrolase [Moraxellaceae bacterium]|nr:GDSL-like Lipase/Acylhydrolase [Moraxellaceae bacterium]
MENRGRYIGNVGRFDPVLGYVPLENGSGGWLIHGGDPVPFHHDDEGRRVAKGVKHGFQGVRRPRILFLGDSFTYGQLVVAEDAFPSRVAAELDGESINAGVPGYGLAQMTLVAERLIPKYKPDYVVAQYSEWLPVRATSEFATDREGLIMAPYVFESGSELRIAPVPFNPPANSILHVEKYKQSKGGLWEEVSFIVEIAFPFYLKRDSGLALLRISQQLGISPRPSKDPERITRFSYARMDEIARENGAKLIILALGHAEPLSVPGHLFPKGVAGVNAWRAMVEKLSPQVSDEYVVQYYLSRGTPPRPVDWHPNERAHEVIAGVVAERVRMLELQKQQEK